MSRLFNMAVAGVLLGGGAILYWFDPLKVRFFPQCPLHLATRLHCPGCGTLRALHRLLHGDLPGALAMNSLAVISLPLVGLLLLRPAWGRRVWVPWAFLGIYIGYGILRNIPVYPFLFLAPH